jgi:RNA polymerase sigma-70 factor (ECF subfamily)
MSTVDPLVQRAAAGDMNAFEELYRAHNHRVYNLCLRMTHNTSDAEDLTQDVFVQLFRKLETFRGESSFSTWLHRLTVNEVLMHFRRRAARPQEVTDEGGLPNESRLPNGSRLPAQNLLRTSVLDRISLNEALRNLSPGYRTVLIMHDLQGYDHAQIGQLLGVAIGTSKSQSHKARLKLRRLLRMGSRSGRR